ncbi:hypothetical protein ASF32_21525 [Methylobacterium sp. Leaf91]|nr:hypothetical protein ASF32_21525 [Methylobacterium sp. Leaf91]
MAALANWRDDNIGALGASRGAGDVYTVATSQGFLAASVARPHTLRFRVASANQTPASLSLDGLPAKPLLRARGRPVGPGDMAPDTVYAVSYIPSEGAYFVTSPAIERPGRIVAQADAAMEPGWLPCDGRAVSRAAYSALFAVIGTTWGNGDGTTTFNIPDLRGRAMFGADDLGGTAANLLTGVGGVAGIDGDLGSTGGAQAVTLTTAQMSKHTHTGTAAEAGGHSHGGSTGSGGSHDHGGSTGPVGEHTHSGTTATGGSHSHTGSAAEAGSHSHNVKFSQSVLAGGNDIFGAIAIGSNGANGSTDAGGSHTHSVTINARQRYLRGHRDRQQRCKREHRCGRVSHPLGDHQRERRSPARVHDR